MSKIKIERAYGKDYGILITDLKTKTEIILYKEDIHKIIKEWNETKMMLSQKKQG